MKILLHEELLKDIEFIINHFEKNKCKESTLRDTREVLIIFSNKHPELMKEFLPGLVRLMKKDDYLLVPQGLINLLLSHFPESMESYMEMKKVLKG